MPITSTAVPAATDAPAPAPLEIEIPSLVVPALISSAGGAATERYVEFFVATIRNPNTRRACQRAARRFFVWCDQAGIGELGRLRPLHAPPMSRPSRTAMSAPRSSCISPPSAACSTG